MNITTNQDALMPGSNYNRAVEKGITDQWTLDYCAKLDREREEEEAERTKSEVAIVNAVATIAGHLNKICPLPAGCNIRIDHKVGAPGEKGEVRVEIDEITVLIFGAQFFAWNGEIVYPRDVLKIQPEER